MRKKRRTGCDLSRIVALTLLTLVAATTKAIDSTAPNPWIQARPAIAVPTQVLGRCVDGLQPTALATGDFDRDGVPDLVSAYAANSGDGGLLLLHGGNVDALWPHSADAQQRRGAGTFAADPFPAAPLAFDLEATPDLVASGDFDADGNCDIVFAPKAATSLHWLRGDGRGGFLSVAQVLVPGGITALAAGEIGAFDGAVDLAVGVVVAEEARLLLFRDPAGALRGAAETVALSWPATAIAMGALDDHYPIDVAVAAGPTLALIYCDARAGAATSAGASTTPTSSEIGRLHVEEIAFPLRIAGLALGDFLGERRLSLAFAAEDGQLHLLRRDQRNGSWIEAAVPWTPHWMPQQETAPRPWPAAYGAGFGLQLSRGRVSSRAQDDLIVCDAREHQVQVIPGEVLANGGAPHPVDSSAAAAAPEAAPVAAQSWSVQGLPIAFLPLRLNDDALDDVVLLAHGSITPLSIRLTQPARTFTVTSAGTESDCDLSDNSCGTGPRDPNTGKCAGPCTLKAAIEQANASPGADRIEFSVASVGDASEGGNPHQISEALTIDGTSRGRVEVKYGGLTVTAGRSVIRGLALSHSATVAIHPTPLSGASSGSFIENNHFIPDPADSSNLGGIDITDASDNTVGGDLSAARNVISSHGIAVTLLGNATGNRVAGNFIGTDATGMIASGTVHGVLIGVTEDGLGGISPPPMNNRIENNVISGAKGAPGPLATGVGVAIHEGLGNRIEANLVGMAADAVTPLPNAGPGIQVSGAGNKILNNRIAHNQREGVIVAPTQIVANDKNTISKNSIFANGGLGIDLGGDGVTANDSGDGDSGPNGLQNFPEARVAPDGRSIQGTLASRPNTRYEIEFFANTGCDPLGYGEGGQYLGSFRVTTAADGRADFTAPIEPPANMVLTATATELDANGQLLSTSEFSSCGFVVGAVSPSVAPNVIEPGYFQEPLTVTIQGSGFLQGAEVSFGPEIQVDPKPARFKSATELEVELRGFENLKEGFRDVTVKNPDGSQAIGKEAFFVSSLLIHAFEFNQAVPMLGTAAQPCIGDHNTVVRVRIECNGAGCEPGKDQTTGWLHLRRDGQALPDSPFAARLPLAVFTRGTARDPASHYDAFDTLNFAFLNQDAIPEGSYEITFEADPRNPSVLPPRLPSPDLKRNLTRQQTPVVFRNSRADRPLHIAVAVDAVNATATRVMMTQVLAFADYLRASYPISRSQVTWTPVSPNLAYTDDKSTIKTLAEFHNRLKQSGDPTTHVILFTSNPAFVGGLSNCDGTTCDSSGMIIRLFDAGSVPHEMGHQFNLGDTYSPPSVTSPNNLITPACEALKEGCPVEDGHFVTTLGKVTTTVSPSDPRFRAFVMRDFMGGDIPLRERWVDKRTWNHLYPMFNATGGAGPNLVPRQPQTLVIVSGEIGTDNTAEFSPFVRFSGPLPASDRPPGDYTVELLDSAQRVLAARSFQPIFFFTHRPQPPPRVPFNITVPYPATTARIVLKRGSTELASRLVSPSPPTVRVLAPNGGETVNASTTVTWSSADPDGGALTHTVLYSPDGVRWIPLALGLTGSSFVWDTSLAPGSSAARIRVFASDGVNEASDTSDAPFSVQAKGPSFAIAAPADRATLPANETVVLQGSGFDPEDGELPDAALTFTSSLDGVLGTGRQVLVNRLATGVHTLTLAGSDKHGNPAQTSIVVTVGAVAGEPNLILSAPNLNFGNVQQGAQRQLTLNLRNTGTATLQILALTSDNARFTVATPALPFDIAPGAERSVEVRFSPNSPGPQAGTLTIVSNDPSDGTQRTALAGVGIADTASVRRAQAQLHCLSLRFQPAVAAVLGQTFRLELTSLFGDESPNGELFPSFGVFDYTHLSDFFLTDPFNPEPLIGTLLVNVPSSADANTNDIPDFFEVSQAVATTAANGEFFTDADTGVVRATWRRDAGSKTGTCRIEMEGLTFGLLPEFTASFDVLELIGPLDYTPASNTVTGAVSLTQTLAPTNTLAGPVLLARVATNRFDQLTLADGSWTNALARALAFDETLLERSTALPSNYAALLTFADGSLNTVEDDYADWLLFVIDTNDADADGIPDLSDDPAGPGPGAGAFTGVRLEAGKVVIEWQGAGALESAPDVRGPWLAVPNAVSPHTTDPALDARRFFRLAR